MEEREAQLQIEDEVRSMGIEQMRREKALLASELKSIEAQISDLAFNNYGTYADAGRATHDCSKVFHEMRDKTDGLSAEISHMNEEFQSFRAKSKALSAEQELIRKAIDKSNPVWELLSLPSRMDICIRAGYYDSAYSLTNYGMQLQQQSALIKNPLIKKVSDRLVEARSYLLEELFNKFAGPLDLAESIKVVNNVRKMPYLTANQLRIAILQHRDIYLDKLISDIQSLATQAIEIYRTCMYDTLVLYLAVFPENEVVRKDPSVDPRWESWPVLPPSAILSQWAIANIKRLLDLIHRVDMKSPIDVSSVWTKLMTVASSFGRMGIDFRPLILSSITKMVEDRFRHTIRDATTKLTTEAKTLVMINLDVSSLPTFDVAPDAPPVPAPELSLWDDVTVFANNVVEALNSIRFVLSPILLETIVATLRDSLRTILSWLATSHPTSPNFQRAIRIVCICLMPFLEKCIIYFFPQTCISKYFGSSITPQQYNHFVEIDPKSIAASSDSSEKIEEVLLPMLQKKKLADIDLDAVLRKKGPEAEKSRQNELGDVQASEAVLEQGGQNHEEQKLEEKDPEDVKASEVALEEEKTSERQKQAHKEKEPEDVLEQEKTSEKAPEEIPTKKKTSEGQKLPEIPLEQLDQFQGHPEVPKNLTTTSQNHPGHSSQAELVDIPLNHSEVEVQRQQEEPEDSGWDDAAPEGEWGWEAPSKKSGKDD